LSPAALAALASGEGSAAGTEHAASCLRCRAALAEQRAVRAVVVAIDAPRISPSRRASLSVEVLARVAPPVAYPAPPRWRIAGALAALAAGTVVTLWATSGSPPPTSTEAEAEPRVVVGDSTWAPSRQSYESQRAGTDRAPPPPVPSMASPDPTPTHTPVAPSPTRLDEHAPPTPHTPAPRLDERAPMTTHTPAPSPTRIAVEHAPTPALSPTPEAPPAPSKTAPRPAAIVEHAPEAGADSATATHDEPTGTRTPAMSAAAFRVGWTALHAGRNADAVAAFDRATDDAVAEDAAYWGAVAAQRAGDATGAQHRFWKFLTRFPASPRAADARAALAALPTAP
jgi:hypothetical protein